MNILVLNGSPRPGGNTAALVSAFAAGASQAGHTVNVVHVGRKRIAGCLGCDYCRREGAGRCIQRDDMDEIYALLEDAEMIVLASPVYYFGFSSQLQCAISRFYAPDKPSKLKKGALILSSGSDGVYDGAVYAYEHGFVEYLQLEDMGVFTAFDKQNKSPEKLRELREFGSSLK